MKLIELESEDNISIRTETKANLNDNLPEKPKLYDANNANDVTGFGDLTNDENIPNMALAMKGFQFAESVTMHGLRYIFMRGIGKIRRLIWTTIVLAGMAYCYYVVYQTLSSYYEYPTTTKVKRNFERKSEFPAITICNYNMFQKSKLSGHAIKAIESIYGTFGHVDEASLDLERFNEVNMTQFYYDTSFSYPNTLCYYKNKRCNQSLFSLTFTDFGICTVFDPSIDAKARYQTTPGQIGGFYWGEIFHPEDWISGPRNTYEGFRIAIHKPGTKVAFIEEQGMPLIPGETIEIMITREEITFMPPPHGECGTKYLQTTDVYSYSQCQVECRKNHTVKICGCRFIYMPGTENICTIKQLFECHPFLHQEKNETLLYDESACNCPQDCNKIDYDLQVSNAQLSQGYIQLVKDIYKFDVKERGVGFRVFYVDQIYKTSDQVPVYTIEKLLCDVGGASGLFLGCSFVTFVEFLDFAIEFIWFWTAKGALLRRKKSNQIKAIT